MNEPGWVVRTNRERDIHACPWPKPTVLGDLWRCPECSNLWRVAFACDACDHYGRDVPHRGVHSFGATWRDAKLWQRVLHWRQGKQ